jgi:hypothetical protein
VSFLLAHTLINATNLAPYWSEGLYAVVMRPSDMALLPVYLVTRGKQQKGRLHQREPGRGT